MKFISSLHRVKCKDEKLKVTSFFDPATAFLYFFNSLYSFLSLLYGTGAKGARGGVI